MWNILRRLGCRGSQRKAIAEKTFQRLLYLEWKRAKRSQRRFVLMLLEPGSQTGLGGLALTLALTKILRVLPDSTRETDIVGWYKDGSAIGVIFTELGAVVDDRTVRNVLCAKVSKVLHSALSPEQANQVSLSLQLFPTHDITPVVTPAVTDDMRVAARYRDPVRIPRLEEMPSGNEVLALRATNSSS